MTKCNATMLSLRVSLSVWPWSCQHDRPTTALGCDPGNSEISSPDPDDTALVDQRMDSRHYRLHETHTSVQLFVKLLP